MKFNIVTSELFLTTVVCALSIVSSKDYSSNNDEDQDIRSLQPNLQIRRSADPTRIIHTSHQSGVKTYTSHQSGVKTHTSHKSGSKTYTSHYSVINTTGGVNQNFAKNGDLLVINVLTRERPASVQYVESKQYYNIVPKYLVPNLRTSGRFRDNVVFILGYILQSPKSGLSSEQYLSLEIIYNAIKRRQVHMYSLLPVLDRIQNKPKDSQFRDVMYALSRHLPAYLACAAKLIVVQIDKGVFNSKTIFANSTENLEFLADINTNDIELGKKYSSEDELTAYDEVSYITEVTLGRLFVKLFKSLSDHTLYISQPLFACILRNLPNPDGDPIFNEYIRFIAELTWDKKIPNWRTKKYTPAGQSVYVLISTITERICSDVEVSYDIKQALWYIRDHFLKSAENIISQSAHEAHLITREGFDVNLLISLITPEEYNPHVIRLKYQLIQYISSNTIVIQSVLAGMNRYGYSSPQQLLLAFLTRLRTRLPVEHIEIRKIVSSLHSILIVKRQVWNISPPSQGGVTLWTLLETINDSEINPETSHLVQIIFEELLQKVTTWEYIQNIVIPSKSECFSAEVCLHTMLTKIIKILPPQTLTTTTYESINKLLVTINVEGYHTEYEYRNVTQKPEGTNSVAPGTPTQHPQVSFPSTENPLQKNNTGTTSKYPPVTEHPNTDRPSTVPNTAGTPIIGLNVTVYQPSNTTISSEIRPTHPPSTTVTTTHKPETTIPTGTGSTDQPATGPTNTHEIYESPTTEPTPKKPSVNIPTSTDQPDTIQPVTGNTTHGIHITPTTEPTPTKPSVNIPTSTDQPDTIQPVTGNTTHEIHGIPTTEPTPTKPSVNIPTSTDRPDTIQPVTGNTTHGIQETPATETTPTKPSVNIPTSTDRPDTIQPVTGNTTHEIQETPATETTPTKPSVNIPTSTAQPDTIQPVTGNTTHGIQETPATETTPTKPSVNIPTSTDRPDTIQPVTGNTTHEIYRTSTTESPVTIPTTGHPPTTITPPEPTNQPGTNHTNPDEPTTSKPDVQPTTPPVIGVTPGGGIKETIIYPDQKIYLVFQDLEVPIIVTEKEVQNYDSSVVVVIPSSNCLSSPSSEILQDECGEDLIRITKPLIKIFGQNYIEVLLGSDWKVHYPRKIDLFIALVQKLETNEKITTNTELLTIIKMFSVGFSIAVQGLHGTPDIFSRPTTTTQKPSTNYDEKVGYNVTVIPETIKPSSSIHMDVTESGVVIIETSEKPDSVNLPSLVCLQEKPSESNINGKCDDDLIQITQPLVKIFGENYVEVILGSDWQIRYPTRISLLIALLKNLEKNPKITTQTNLVTTITKYRVACQFITSYVFLPLLVNYKKLTTEVVWSTYDSESPSNSNIGSDRPVGLGSNVVAVPLPNPQTWLLPVDVNHPFSNFFPSLPKNDPYAIQLQPLKLLFETNSIYQLLGESWNPAQYPNRGVLFVSVLHTILKHQTIRSNPQLYELVRNYLYAIEGPSTSVPIPQTYIKKSTHTYTTIWTIQHPPISISKTDGSTIEHIYTVVTYKSIGMLPTSVKPELSIHLTVSKYGTAKVISSTSTDSTEIVSVPSVICLQSKPSANNPNDECAKDLTSITQRLIKIFGEHYIEVILGKDWIEHYPTRLSFLVALLERAQKNPKIAQQTELIQIIERYNIALRYVASYVLLPLLADYKELKGLVVWSTVNTKEVSMSYIGQDRPEESDVNVISLPIVNPVILLLPVNHNDPFSIVIPNISPDGAYSAQFQNFVTLFKSGKVRELLGSSWSPSQYSNNGDLLISVLHILLTLESVKSNTELYHFIHNYVKAIELPTIYGQISQEYIEKVVHKHSVSFTFEGSHDTVQLPPGNYSLKEKIVFETIQVTNVTTTTQVQQWSTTYIEYITKTILQLKGPFLPPSILPGMSIHVQISESGAISVVSPEQPSTVILPSFDCLQNKAQPHDTNGRCQKDLNPVRGPLIEIFGSRYIEVILGKDWQERYPTRISFLVALLTNVEGNYKIKTQTQLLQMIRSYKIACEFIASYVMLPMIIDSQNLNTIVVWSVYDSANPSASYITSVRPDGLGNNVVVLPLVNPLLWRLQVDVNHPVDLMLPQLGPDDQYYTAKLKPLFSLLQPSKIHELLGDRWNPSQYPNRGALFISVVRELLETTFVQSDRQLYNLLYQYRMAFEIPALYNLISHTYIKTIFDRYRVTWVKERYEETIEIPSKIPLPPKIHPKKILQVIIPEYGSPIVESVISIKKRSKKATILPSVECLQGPWTSEEDTNNDDQCDSVLEFRLTQHLIDVFGDDYGKEILGNDWSSHYPTRIAFLAGLLRSGVKNQKVISNPKLFKIVKTYKEALEIAAPYIFLPWLSMYQQLNTSSVWLTFNANHSWHSHMARRPPRTSANDGTMTLPIMNPKIWLMPVNIDHPFSGFLPDLSPTDPYEEKVAHLRSLLSLDKLRDLTGRAWNPSLYPNRGLFFVSVMHTLLKLRETRLRPPYNEIVLHYYMAIEIPALYVHIPRSYITKSVSRAGGRWGVDLVDLMFALKEARTEEEIRLWAILEVWLMNGDLLKQLGISAPSLTASKSSLLMMIFETALSSTTIQISAEIKLALQTFKSRILTTGAGAGAISWIWISVHSTEYTYVVLQDVFSSGLQIDEMTTEVKYHYDKLIEYFAMNPTKLTTEGFPLGRYHTYGSFLRAFLYYLTQNPEIPEDARGNIHAVIPYVIYTGPGATPMPEPTRTSVS